MRRVSQEHIDAALAAVFGDSKQLAGREPNDEQQEGEWQWHLQHLDLLWGCRLVVVLSVSRVSIPQQAPHNSSVN